MPRSSPDRALRRLIARLAEATPDDREAVLGDLTADEQQEIARLLSDYRGLDIGPAAPPPAATATAWSEGGFSSALVARLEAPAGVGMRIPSPPASAEFAREPGPELTPLALDALRDCARQIRPRFGPSAVRPAARSDDGLFRRLWGIRSI